MNSATSTQNPTRILLLGAGELGHALLPHISALPNTHVTIGLRSPLKHAHLRSSTVSFTALDLTSASATLVSVFSTYDILIAATGFTSAPGSPTKLALEVLEAGKRRKSEGKAVLWFFPWQWVVDYDVTGDGRGLMPLFGEQKGVRDLLRDRAVESGVMWTVVSTGIFMSFLFEPFWGIVDRSKGGMVTARCLRDWEHGVTVTDVGDIGRVLARVLAGDVEAGNKVLYVAGDTITYAKLAVVLERATGYKVVRETWSVEHLERELSKDFDDGIKKYRLVFAGEGVWWGKESTVNQELGMEMMDVETYTKKIFGVQ
ncbi:NAD(P)-binding protein [Lizonia empirigonia]|nr:NAD(P)-binding protein [Lizonia empirigonia]